MKVSRHDPFRETRESYAERLSRLLMGVDTVNHENIVGAERRKPDGPTRSTKNIGMSTSRIEVQEDGVYIISVAARILDMHPQTLRKYERVGLVSPSRTVGMLRLYSGEDIIRLRLIKYLVDERGLNLAGVQMALEVFNYLLRVQAALDSVDGRQIRAFFSDTIDEVIGMLSSAQVYR